MAHDYISDLDRMAKELNSLRSSLAKQAGSSAQEATSYLAPRARQLAKQFQGESYGLSRAAQRNPAAATGAILGALAIGAVIGLFLAGSNRDDA